MTLNVIGNIWTGHECSYSYQVSRAPETMREVQQIAGDFECVTDFQVTDVLTRSRDGWHCQKPRIIHDWSKPESADTFMASDG